MLKRDRADTAQHEAVHACVACALGRKVEWLRVADRPIEGRRDVAQSGACRIDRYLLDARDVAISLAPGMYEDNGIAADIGAATFGTWPPIYATLGLEAIGDRHQVGALVAHLRLDEVGYDRVIELTREIIDDPAMRAWISKVADRLLRDRYIDGEVVDALRPPAVPDLGGIVQSIAQSPPTEVHLAA